MLFQICFPLVMFPRLVLITGELTIQAPMNLTKAVLISCFRALVLTIRARFVYSSTAVAFLAFFTRIAIQSKISRPQRALVP